VNDGFWTDNGIYWTLSQPVTTLHRSLSHWLVFSVTLLGNGIQWRTFLCFRAHVLVGWQPSHAKLILDRWLQPVLPSADSSRTGLTSNCQPPTLLSILDWLQLIGFHTELTHNAQLTPYVASARTTKKIPLPAVPLLLNAHVA
jgi:hypothetical protein